MQNLLRGNLQLSCVCDQHALALLQPINEYPFYALLKKISNNFYRHQLRIEVHCISFSFKVIFIGGEGVVTVFCIYEKSKKKINMLLSYVIKIPSCLLFIPCLCLYFYVALANLLCLLCVACMREILISTPNL